MLEALLLIAVLAGPAAALAPRRAGPVVGAGAVSAVGLGIAALTGSSITRWGLSTTGIAPLALVLTTAMGATVLGYAGRNLRHEPYQRRFAVLGSLLVTAASVVVLADDLILLAAAWIATSTLTVAMLRTGPEPGREARSTGARTAFLIGDSALLLAIGLLSTNRAPVVAGLLVVVAAASRSASGPFYRWLPASIGAPTPSSALLHAGVVNGGAILLIKLAPEVGGLTPVAVAAALVGGLSCVFAEAVMLTRPDVKGRLAWSTIAQMSFTLLLCGLGLPLAAGLHLVAHGFYKGALFLGSGTGVRAGSRARCSPTGRTRAAAGLAGAAPAGLAYAVPVAAIAGVLAVSSTAPTASLAVPILLVLVASGQAGRAAFARTTSTAGGAGALVVTGALAGLYVAGTVTLDGALHPLLPETVPALSALWIAPVLASLVLIAASRSRHHRVGGLEARAWTVARRIGRPGVVVTPAPPRPAVRRPGASTVPPTRQPRPDLALSPQPDLAGAMA